MKNIDFVNKPRYAKYLDNGKFVAAYDDDDDWDWGDKVWYRDYECPKCHYKEEDVEIRSKYAPIRFCPRCRCQMN